MNRNRNRKWIFSIPLIGRLFLWMVNIRDNLQIVAQGQNALKEHIDFIAHNQNLLKNSIEQVVENQNLLKKNIDDIESMYHGQQASSVELLDKVNNANHYQKQGIAELLAKISDANNMQKVSNADLLTMVSDINNWQKQGIAELLTKINDINCWQKESIAELVSKVNDSNIGFQNQLENLRDLLVYVKRSTTSSALASKYEIDNLQRKYDKAQKTTARIHFVRCIDVRNTGDMNCGPEQYFHEFMQNYTCFFHTIENVAFNIIDKDDWVIIGGGGLLNCYLLAQGSINQLLHISDRVIMWGVGHNTHDTLGEDYWKGNLQIDYGRAYILACRDWDYESLRFCPCVSCMMEDLSKSYEIVRRIGIVDHHEFPIMEFDYERINNSLHIEALLQFIGSSEIIISNTYHGAYWSILMGKKVILTNTFSDKFNYFKHKPVIYSGDLESDIARAETYPNALWEYRNLNITLKEEIIKNIDMSMYASIN